MKNLLILLGIFYFSFSFAAHPDIIVKTRFDTNSSSRLTKRLRNFLVKNELGDPYKQTMEAPLAFDMAQTVDVSKNNAAWVKELRKLLNLSVVETNAKLRIDKLSYAVGNFTPDLRSASAQENRIEYVTVNLIEGLAISAQKITLDVELSRRPGEKPTTISIELVDPRFVIKPELVSEIGMEWSSTLLPGELLLSLNSINIQKMIAAIAKRPEMVELSVKRLFIPNFELQVGNRRVQLEVNLQNVQDSNIGGLKQAILEVMSDKAGERLKNIIADSPKEIMLPRYYYFDNAVKGMVFLNSIHPETGEILTMNYTGNFCSLDTDLSRGNCQQALATPARRTITDKMHQQSLSFLIKKLLNESNIAVSVSETFLNNAIAATMASGLWEKELAKKPFRLGPEKLFVLAEEQGKNLSLYMDIIYPLGRAQRLLVGQSELRFPVKFSIGLKIVNKKGLPHFKIMVNDVLMDDEITLYGLPQYNMPSTVQNGRFRGRVLDKIFRDLGKFKGQAMFEMEIAEFKDTYLEELHFLSDGMGRATAVVGFK